MFFFRVILYELKAPHFCSKFVQSSTENDFTSLELHRNAQKSRDLMFASLKLRTLCLHVLQFHRKKQWYCILSSLLSRKLTHLWGSELEASHICSKFVKSSRKRCLLRPELHKNRLLQIYWSHCKLTTLEWKLHGFSRVIFCEFEAPHFMFTNV